MSVYPCLYSFKQNTATSHFSTKYKYKYFPPNYYWCPSPVCAKITRTTKSKDGSTQFKFTVIRGCRTHKYACRPTCGQSLRPFRHREHLGRKPEGWLRPRWSERGHCLGWAVTTYIFFTAQPSSQRFVLRGRDRSVLTISTGRNSSLVVFGLAVHSVAGSILLWGKFPVEGIFSLELTWVQTPFRPKKLFRMTV